MARSAGPPQKCLHGCGAADSSGEQPQQQCHVGVHVSLPSGVVMVGHCFGGLDPVLTYA
jgi:hypothetical protein